MSHREPSSNGPEIRLCKTVPRGRLPEAFMLDHVKPSCRQHNGQSLSALVGCPNICCVLSSQHAGGEQRRTYAPAHRTWVAGGMARQTRHTTSARQANQPEG
jgi:hypothetical protein